ncbi:ankyrin repeat domain-containing protein [Gordonia sp. 852002-50395_SCH5434458]|uniref:ankyrin repeat domain-containing protein n=1 Tax=Gordonia sp. 852002-50395_SCH5434458 TaxID=1834090 RepID=UPI0007E99BFD|nr:ankyrin repeat domain-containing protein [Gordonia sp. 852002-50395_SCH5434458]OBC02711.1 hypothetical protein A5785_02550 [Gordonia sp. 852002-50395_SCH5434458]
MSEIDTRDRLDRTPLHYAAVDGDLKELKKLIAAGADVNAREARDWTPLHFAAESLHPEVVEALIAAGAEVDAQNDRGETPLHLTIGRGGYDRSAATATVLRRAGADVHKPDARGGSPIDDLRETSNEVFPVRDAFTDLL